MNQLNKKNLNHLYNLPDEDNNFNLDEVRCCKECGSLNIEIDLETNKIVCKDCKSIPQDGERKTFESLNEERIEEEQENIKKAIKRGEQFNL